MTDDMLGRRHGPIRPRQPHDFDEMYEATPPWDIGRPQPAFLTLADAGLFQGTVLDAGEECGAEANMAKLLSSEASWEAANAAVQFHGGYGFAEEYDIERKFRETRLYQVAPISTNLILSYVGEHVLGMPRSF